MTSHIILIGLRGSGKTTIAQRLSRDLSTPFIDLDTVTPGILGHSDVASAWNAAGEPGFRAAETKALEKTLASPPSIIALGGGTPTAPGAVESIARARGAGARVVYLHASPEHLHNRLAGADNAHRPSLTGLPPSSLEEIRRVYKARHSLYIGIATDCLLVEALSLDDAVRALQRLLTELPR